MTKLILGKVLCLILSLPAVADAGSSANELPLTLYACNLVESLQEPERSLHLTMAQSLAEAQSRVLATLTANRHEWTLNEQGKLAVSGLTLALQEYWERELSFPASADCLIQSGYLQAGWAAAGVEVALTLDTIGMNREILEIYYGAQPKPLAKVMSTPGRACNISRYCFSEYALFVSVTTATQMGLNAAATSSWAADYEEFGLIELMHFSADQPGASKCVFCPH